MAIISFLPQAFLVSISEPGVRVVGEVREQSQPEGRVFILQQNATHSPAQWFLNFAALQSPEELCKILMPRPQPILINL